MMPRGERLNDILARAHSVSALLALLERPRRMTDLNEAMGGYAGNAKILAYAFKEAGIVTIQEEPGPFGKTAYLVELTKTGKVLAQLLEKMVEHYPDEFGEPGTKRDR